MGINAAADKILFGCKVRQQRNRILRTPITALRAAFDSAPWNPGAFQLRKLSTSQVHKYFISVILKMCKIEFLRKGE